MQWPFWKREAKDQRGTVRRDTQLIDDFDKLVQYPIPLDVFLERYEGNIIPLARATWELLLLLHLHENQLLRRKGELRWDE